MIHGRGSGSLGENILGYSDEWDVRNEKARFTPFAEPHRSERGVLGLIINQGLHTENVGPLVNSGTIEGALLHRFLREVLPLLEAVNI